MKAITVTEQGDLAWVASDVPAPGPGEVLISVHASAVNRADLAQRAGNYPPPPGTSSIMGLECAGEIAALGPGETRWRVGDRVCALLAGGGYAEQVVCPAAQVLPIPGALSLAEAASLPEVFATAYLNLFMEAGLTPGERVLLHAGASGVGTAGIQLCRAFGNEVFVTAGSQEKIARCLALGARAGSDRHRGRFLDRITEWTDGHGIDVILDPVGAGYLGDNLEALAVGGRLVLIALLGGRRAEIDLGRLLMKRLRVVGSTLRARPIAEKGEIMAALETRVWPRIASGDVKPVIDSEFDIRDTDAAHQRVAANASVGKVVLRVHG